MGLIKAAMGAAGSVMADQWRSIFTVKPFRLMSWR